MLLWFIPFVYIQPSRPFPGIRHLYKKKEQENPTREAPFTEPCRHYHPNG